jgi:carbon-monoxide dehydrogenase medium subunit
MVEPPRLHQPTTVGDAVAAIREDGAVPIAGGTWVMRSPLRNEPWAKGYVALTGLPELRGVEIAAELRIGACVTHAELAGATAGEPWLRGLHRAAARSANPAVRRMATVGGNLCTAAFPAADLSPALLCLGAQVVVSGDGHERRLPLADLLSAPASALDGRILREVRLPRSDLLTGHARLPLRAGGGDYPVAIVSVALAAADGLIETARVAVGSVEPVPRRWPELEAALAGCPLDPAEAVRCAERTAHGWSGRDDVDAPGWYRRRVLPPLVGRAVGDALGARAGGAIT